MSDPKDRHYPSENWERGDIENPPILLQVRVTTNEPPTKIARKTNPKMEKKTKPENNDAENEKNGKDDRTNQDDKKDKPDKSNEVNEGKDTPASAVRPPRLTRPKITLKMPPMSPQIPQFYNTPSGMITIPLTPATGLPANYQIDVFQAYPSKAQEFMFKQFEDFKDFTKNTGKLGLSFGERFAFWCYGKARGLSTNSFTHILLLILICLYCALGGLAFFIFEQETRDEIVEKIKREDHDQIQNVTEAAYNITLQYCNKTSRLNSTWGNFTKITKGLQQDLMEKLKGKILELNYYYHAQYSLNRTKEKWEYLNSMYFCGTVFTTIGYGHLAPITTAGRIITIIYAIFGIPLFLLLLADYGKLLTRGIKFVWAYVRRLYYTGSCRKVRKTAPVQEVVKGMQLVIDNVNKVRKLSNARLDDEPVVPRPVSPVDTPAFSAYTVDDNFNIPISVAFAILILYIIGGAFLFSFLQNWNFFEAFYFVFISTSTIGLGDYVPEGKVEILLCSLVYFVIGLALTTMCINVVTEKLTDSFRAATAKIGATMGLELAGEEDIDMDLKEEEN